MKLEKPYHLWAHLWWMLPYFVCSIFFLNEVIKQLIEFGVFEQGGVYYGFSWLDWFFTIISVLGIILPIRKLIWIVKQIK